MTQKEFLLDTIAYYSEDTERRCVTEDGCYYSPLTINNKKSDGCAIGRWLDPNVAVNLDSLGCKPVINYVVTSVLPEKLLKLGVDFLKDIQELHDEDTYWYSDGLSRYGKNKVNSIIDTWNLDIPKYK